MDRGRRKIFLNLIRVVAALSFFVASLSASQSYAQARTKSAEVLIVLAKEEAGEIDTQLAEYQALRKPPFSNFGSMKVLGRPKLRLELGKDSVVSLPNGRKMKVRWEDTSPDGRYRISTSISREKADYLPLLTVLALPNDPFFVAGQSFQGGTLVIGVRLLEH